MARRVFFSFHYYRDLWRVNVVRNSGAVEGISAAGFRDASLWQEASRKGDLAIKSLIDIALKGTTVTIVLVGAQTATRRYVTYEIQQSVARGNGIFGITINNIKDKDGALDPPGLIPEALKAIAVPIYQWDYAKLPEWVERAAKSSTPPDATRSVLNGP